MKVKVKVTKPAGVREPADRVGDGEKGGYRSDLRGLTGRERLVSAGGRGTQAQVTQPGRAGGQELAPSSHQCGARGSGGCHVGRAWSPAASSSLGLVHHLLLSSLVFIACVQKALCAKLLRPCPTLCDPMDCSPVRLLCPWDSPGQKTGVGWHALLQELFLTQDRTHVSSICLHWQAGPSPLAPPGKPMESLGHRTSLNLMNELSSRVGSQANPDDTRPSLAPAEARKHLY